MLISYKKLYIENKVREFNTFIKTGYMADKKSKELHSNHPLSIKLEDTDRYEIASATIITTLARFCV